MTLAHRAGAAGTSLADRAGLGGAARDAAVRELLARLRAERITRVRIAWGDLHGTLRGKTLVLGADGEDAGALQSALANGIGMVSTLMQKDTSDRTVFKVFEPGAAAAMPGLRGASNLLLLPDPASFKPLPWAEGLGWLRASPHFADGQPVAIDPRGVLERAAAALAAKGYSLRCGLEVEFHIHRIVDARLTAEQAAWPAEPPAVELLHPGYNLLAENWADMADEALEIVRRTALGLGLPLTSLEIELGPSQFEAVFGAIDALAAADHMLLFRSGVRQALRRAGYHASFVCRPPLPNAIASGWHLHHSLVDGDGANAFMRDVSAPGAGTGAAAGDARAVLSDFGAHWLAGLLAHARGMAALCAPTLPAYSRYQGSVMAPQAALWGSDNRGAMLRVLGSPGDATTRIENRLGEPMANPYLYMAAQIIAGLDGLERSLEPGPATEAPYADEVPAANRLPTTLAEALDALAADAALQRGIGEPMARLFAAVKRQEIARHDAAEDREAWQRREYFGRY